MLLKRAPAIKKDSSRVKRKRDRSLPKDSGDKILLSEAQRDAVMQAEEGEETRSCCQKTQDAEQKKKKREYLSFRKAEEDMDTRRR